MNGLSPELPGQHEPANGLEDDLELAVIFVLKFFELFGEIFVRGEQLS